MVKKCGFHPHTESFSSWGCFVVRHDYRNVFCWESHSWIFLNMLFPNRLQTYYWNHVMKMKMLMKKIIVKGLWFSVLIQTHMINLQLFFLWTAYVLGKKNRRIKLYFLKNILAHFIALNDWRINVSNSD